MPPSIHPVDLIAALRQQHLTPAIVFLTSRRACDDAMQAFERDHDRPADGIVDVDVWKLLVALAPPATSA